MESKKTITCLSDYGFSIYSESNDIKVYQKHLDSEMTAQLTVLNNVYTLEYFLNREPNRLIKVANRYVCETKEELDFLIRRGRIGGFF